MSEAGRNTLYDRRVPDKSVLRRYLRRRVPAATTVRTGSARAGPDHDVPDGLANG